MSGQIKAWVIKAGDTLDRRRIQELYYEVAARLSELRGTFWGDKVFARNKFSLDAWEEYDCNTGDTYKYRVPTHGHIAPASLLSQDFREPYWEGQLEWSVEAIGLVTHNYLILGVPVWNDQIVWGGQDYATADQVLQTSAGTNSEAVEANTNLSAGTNDRVGIGGVAHVSGLTTRPNAAVMMLGIGEFQVSKVQLHTRRMV